MAGLATQPTDLSVPEFLDAITPAQKQTDCRALCAMLEAVSGHPPVIWGDHFIVGFGKYTYTRKGGKEVFEWFNMGFAPRSKNITVYVTLDIAAQEDLTSTLGKAKWGKGCLYINKLSDIDTEVLRALLERSKNATVR